MKLPKLVLIRKNNFLETKTDFTNAIISFLDRSKIFNRIFSTQVEVFRNFKKLFESRLKGLQYDESLNPFGFLFVVPVSAWKTKSNKQLKQFYFRIL